MIDLAALKAANVVSADAERAKVVLSGELEKAVTLKGIGVTKGAARPRSRRPAAKIEAEAEVANSALSQSSSCTRRGRRASATSAAACCS